MSYKPNVVFLIPQKPYLKRPDAQVPLGVLYLASVLLDNGYKAQVCDLNRETRVPRADIYGITGTSMELSAVRNLARMLKKETSSKVIVGGPVTTGMESLSGVDSIVRGEAEDIILAIVKDHPKLAQAYEGLPPDVNEIPWPARFLQPAGKGIFALGKEYFGKKDSTQVITSRGCPFKCSFCAAPYLSKGVRYRDPQDVCQEVSHCVRNYGVRQFRVADDMLTANEKHFNKLCGYLGELDIAWRMSARVKPLKEDMLKRAKDAGCREVSFGIESFDDKVLKLLNKGATQDDNVNALEMAHRVGMDARALLMIATPGQTYGTIVANKRFLERVPYTVASCTMFIPVPGSDVWFHPEKYGIEILSREMDDYNFYSFGPEGENRFRPIIKPEGQSVERFYGESEGFRLWLKENAVVNTG